MYRLGNQRENPQRFMRILVHSSTLNKKCAVCSTDFVLRKGMFNV